MTRQSAYLEGFCKIAEANGIDPYRLISFGLQKQAGKIPEPILKILKMNGSPNAYDVAKALSPEQLDLLKRFLIRSQRGAAKNKAIADTIGAKFLRNNFLEIPAGKGSQRTIDGVLEQVKSVSNVQLLPSSIRHSRQEILGDWLKSLREGHLSSYSASRSTGGFEGYGTALNPKKVQRRIKGYLGAIRRQYFKMNPKNRRAALSNFEQYQIPQGTTAEEVAKKWTEGNKF